MLAECQKQVGLEIYFICRFCVVVDDNSFVVQERVSQIQFTIRKSKSKFTVNLPLFCVTNSKRVICISHRCHLVTYLREKNESVAHKSTIVGLALFLFGGWISWKMETTGSHPFQFDRSFDLGELFSDKPCICFGILAHQSWGIVVCFIPNRHIHGLHLFFDTCILFSSSICQAV